MTRPLTPLALIAAMLAVAQADTAVPGRSPAAREPPWPARLSYARLPAPSGQPFTPSMRRRSDLVTRRYTQRGPDGHGQVVDVHYLRGDKAFYLCPDCMMNHADSCLGPYPGDPRLVLAP